MIEYFVPSASTFSGEIDWLFDWITYIVGFWFIVAEVVLFYFIFRFRKKEGTSAEYITGEKKSEKKWISIPHNLILAFDVFIVAMAILAWNKVKINLPEADATVRVIGQQWAWIFVHPGPDGELDTADDIETVDELHIQKGLTYHFELQSRDVLHSFSVPVFRLKQDAVPGRTITGWFEATQTGEYDIQCAEMCGIGHGLMGARIFIEDEAGHTEWVAQNAPSQSGSLVAAK